MKTTINLTIHAPSVAAAKALLGYRRRMTDLLHENGTLSKDVLLEYGKPKGAKRGNKKSK